MKAVEDPATSLSSTYTLFLEGNLVDPRLRASHEQVLIVRVLRARRMAWPPLLLSHPCHLRKIMRKGFHPAGRLAPVEVFVRRVVTMLGQAEPHEQDWHLPGFLHRDHCADRSSFADEGWLFPEPSLHRTLHRLDIGPLKQPFERMEHPLTFDFYVRIQLRHVALE